MTQQAQQVQSQQDVIRNLQMTDAVVRIQNIEQNTLAIELENIAKINKMVAEMDSMTEVGKNLLQNLLDSISRKTKKTQDNG